MAQREHIVSQGECLASIGARYGFDWQTLWDHPRNAKLKSARKDPNILFPGDIVFVPAKELKEEDRSTDARHRFVIKGSPEVLRIRVLNEFDRPLTKLKYELVIGVKTWKGSTDDNGEFKVTIAPTATDGRLFLGDERREVALKLGSLDPVTKISGAQARLANLGYHPGRIDNILGPLTRQALCDFQEQRGLKVTGELDEQTIEILKDRHGR